ncbi:unnamed protein product [Ectocarpus sp. 4 AP-2014]
MQIRKGWILALAFLFSCLLNPGVASSSSSSATPSPSSTPSPSLTPSPGATPSPSGTPAPTSATPSPGGSSSSTSSSSTSSTSASTSSGTSRGTVVAWAFFTVLFGVALLMFLYNREQNKRLRAQRGDLLRQSLASNDTMNPPYHQPEPLPGHKPDPTMSSF